MMMMMMKIRRRRRRKVYSIERHKKVAVATVQEMLRFAFATCTIRFFFVIICL